MNLKLRDSFLFRQHFVNDSLRLGTELYAAGYQKCWATNIVGQNQQLVKCHLEYRVIDSENVGVNYGKNVLDMAPLISPCGKDHTPQKPSNPNEIAD